METGRNSCLWRTWLLQLSGFRVGAVFNDFEFHVKLLLKFHKSSGESSGGSGTHTEQGIKIIEPFCVPFWSWWRARVLRADWVLPSGKLKHPPNIKHAVRESLATISFGQERLRRDDKNITSINPIYIYNLYIHNIYISFIFKYYIIYVYIYIKQYIIIIYIICINYI